MSTIEANINSSLWIQKYKPQTIDDVILDKTTKDKFKEYIFKQEIPNLCFVGSAGNGKTTCAKMLAKLIADKDVLFINASSESGIDVVRNKIEPYCATMGYGDGHKIVILDEMEMSSEKFQTALRATIEQFYGTARFILTCNFYNKVIDPLKSRTQEFKFGEINQVEILKRCMAILNNEGVEFDKPNLAKILKHLGTDMRKIIQTMQKLTSDQDGNKKLLPFMSDEEKLGEMLELIRAKKLTAFRKFLVENNLNPDVVAVFLFNKAFEKKLCDSWIESVAIMGECVDKMKSSINSEITLTHHVLQIIQLM